MSKTVSLVSAATSADGPALLRMVRGLRNAGVRHALTVADLGVDAAVRSELEIQPDRAVRFVPPPAPIHPAGTLFPRVQAPQFSPPADVIAWLNPDLLVLDSRAIDLLIHTAMSRSAAVIPMIDAHYRLFADPIPSRDKLAREWAVAYQPHWAGRLTSVPPIGTAAVAAQRTSQFWHAWRDYAMKSRGALPADRVERMALTCVNRLTQLSPGKLPAWCAWELDQCPPIVKRDGEVSTMFTPGFPSQSISMLHAPPGVAMPEVC